MANAAVDLTTIDKLKARLGLGQVVLSTDDEADLERLVTEVSSRFQTECGDSLIEAGRVDTFDGTNTSRVWLEHGAPPNASAAWSLSVTSVVVDDEAIPASVAGSDGWSLTEGSRVVLTGYRFTQGYGNCVITYTAGFDVTSPAWDVPSDIEGSVIELAALRWKEKDRIGQVSKSVSGETVDFRGSNVWSTFLTVASMYRRPRL